MKTRVTGKAYLLIKRGVAFYICKKRCLAPNMMLIYFLIINKKNNPDYCCVRDATFYHYNVFMKYILILIILLC